MIMTRTEKILLALALCGGLVGTGIARAAEEGEIATLSVVQGETITTRVDNRDTIDGFEDCVFIELPYTTYGGAAIHNEGSIGEITRCTFEDNEANIGGAIYNYEGGYIGTIKDSDFTNNTIRYQSPGGAIYNGSYTTGSTIGSIEGGSFTDNYSYYGGAISNSGRSTSIICSIGSIEGTVFTGNGAYYDGGAIENIYGTIDSISNCTFEGNYAIGYQYAAGGAIENCYSTIGSITGNTFISNSSVYGGAIDNYASSYGATIGSITGNTFTSNSSVYGGAIYNDGTIDEISGNSFTGNTADQEGGAIINASGSSIGSFTNNTFANNGVASDVDDVYGGAIYNAGTITTFESNDFTGNYAVSEDGKAYGGAIYNSGTIGSGDSLVLGNLSGNYAQGATDAKGGAVYDTVYTSATIDSATGNYVKLTGEGDVAGGIIYLEKSETTSTAVTVTGDVTGNHVETASGTAKGGAFYVNENATLTIGGEISGNYALSEDGAAYGGAVYNEGTFSNGENGEGLVLGDLSYNYAQGTTDAKGGAVYDTVNTEVTINGDVIGNYVKVTGEGDVAGGVIYLAQAENEATSVTVSGNIIGNHAETASGNAYGGAFYNNEYGTLTIGGTIIGGDEEDDANYVSAAGKGNVAFGGAIYNAGSLILSDGVEFSRNWAYSSDGTAAGGAIYNADTGTISGSGSSGDLTLGSLTDNYALGYGGDAAGGAIYNENKDVAISVSGDITGNSATAGASDAKGGAIFTIGDVTVEGDEISGNYAIATYDALGGAIYSEGTLIVDVASITDNEAASEFGDAKGGAIYSNGVLYINYDAGSIPDLTGNYAASENGKAYGGAIYNIGTGEGGTLSLGDLTENVAAGVTGAYGGAIYDEISTQIDVYGDVTGNSAVAESGEAKGGAIYNTQGTLSVYGDIGGGTDEDEFNYVMAAGDALGGAIYTEGTLIVDAESITGNKAIGVTEASGGAIYVDNGDAGTSVTVTDEVSGNVAYATEGAAKGGAIYSDGILNLNDDSESCPEFANNYAQSVSGEASGGAIYNTNTETGEGGTLTLGDLTENGAIGGTGASGGAIYDEVSTQIDVLGSMTGNYATTDSGYAKGGAIYLDTTDEVSVNVWDDVTGNHATTGDGSAMGGAIYNNDQGTVTVYGDIGGTGTGEFNFVIATDDDALGGAIYNEGTLIIERSEEGLDPNIGGNAAVSNEEGNAYGGAIYNVGDLTVAAGSIESNYAVSEDGDALGGAIYTEGDLTVTATSITENLATSETGSAAGGAIFISEDVEGSSITVNGNVSGNVASGSEDAAGGAIYSDDAEGSITISGSIAYNYAIAENGTAQGGAIYTAGDVNVIADGATIYVTGNYANDDDNAIYMAADENGTNGSQLTFTLSNGASVFLTDNIQGEGNYDVIISGDGLNNTFYLFNDVNAVSEVSETSVKTYADELATTNNADLSIGNVTLSTVDAQLYTDDLEKAIHTYNVNSFTLTGDFNMEADVDLANEKMDRFVTNDNTYAINGTLNVSGMNVISDTHEDRVAVYFAEPGLMKDVTSSVKTVYSPIYEYELNYVYLDDDGIHHGDETYDPTESAILSSGTQGGYFVFDEVGNDPEIEMSGVEMLGSYNAMSLMFDYSFEHSDYYMKLPADVRLAIREETKARKGKRAPRETDATKPQYYNQNEMTNRGAWVKTFAADETVSYKGRFSSTDKYYGALVGFDTNMHESANGWATVFSGYTGVQGIRQNFSGGHTKQHGGVLGVTESFYKKNFYTAWTAAVVTSKADGHTMYGHEDTHSNTYGIAAKTGWNFEFAGGKFALLPTFTVSYTYVDMKDFTNAAGVRMTGNKMHAVELNPNLKFIMNLDNGWQPYLTVGEVWTEGQDPDVKANGEKLMEELELKSYTEYGIGIQKRWANERDAYIQVLGHSHGRDGIVVNGGIRWNF